ncbi:MAG: hypothetical protein MMC23_000472 [Stictis urceolatum]|nr:hypothetical protein [Stictis urceolata]
MPRIAITGASGKIGSAILHNLLKHSLALSSEITVTTSTHPTPPSLLPYEAQGVSIRHATFDSPPSLVTAFSGCDKLILVSTPRISMDWTPSSGGREAHHIAAITAAREAGVKHVYYTSLGFDSDRSKAGVMRAHNATERFLAGTDEGMGWTVIREGLYCESWPLYLGHGAGAEEERKEVVLCGSRDGRVSWASIDDLGLGTAVLASEEEGKWRGRTVLLSTTSSCTMGDVAGMVGVARGREVWLKEVSEEEHVEYYVKERGLEEGLVKWWVSTYEAIAIGECENKVGMLEEILRRYGREPKALKDTIEEMVAGARE